jgi:hypothetical protein
MLSNDFTRPARKAGSVGLFVLPLFETSLTEELQASSWTGDPEVEPNRREPKKPVQLDIIDVGGMRAITCRA